MTARAVHWHEGMFLRPQHLQAAQRHTAHLSTVGDKWDLHYNWGLRDIDLDLEALANHRLVVRSLRARLRDGTLVSVPEDGLLPAVELKAAFERESSLRVFLGVPQLRLGRANTAADSRGSDGTRYVLDTQNLEDENTGLNPQQVQVRLLNLKLLLSTQDHSGYEVLPIAQVQKSAGADAAPELDVTWIPPVLACDGWKPLANGILQTIFDRIGRRVETDSGLINTRGITFDSQSQSDRRLFERLRVLNEGYALLSVLAFAQGIHPMTAYMELCRLVGQLAIFGKERRPPADLPRYDHDDLGTCFYRIKQYLDAMDESDVATYKERPFIGAGLRMQVSMEPAWLEPAWQMFVGVQSPLSADECIKLLTRSPGLEMKLGSSERVDEIYRLGAPGLRFAHAPRPPRVLPTQAGLIYFSVDRNSQREEWANVQKELSLAIRLNENRIASSIQGQRVLTIKTGGNNTTMQFTLYVVPQEK